MKRFAYMQNLILRRMVLFSDGVTEGKHKVLLEILIFSDFLQRFLSSRFAIILVLRLEMVVLNSELNSA